MENTKLPGELLSPEQVSSIAGGADASCPATATVGTSGASIGTTGQTPGEALIAIYEGFVQVTSHIIDRVMSAQ